MTEESDLGVLASPITPGCSTSYAADPGHVLMAGRAVTSGGPELADKLERVGYEGIAEELGVETLAVEAPAEPTPSPTRRSSRTPSPTRSPSAPTPGCVGRRRRRLPTPIAP